MLNGDLRMKKLNEREVDFAYKTLLSAKKEAGKIITGQEKIIDGLLRAIIADGHVLVEGVPGLAKTLIVRVLAKISGCEFSRVQFTSDLLPTDILGVNMYNEKIGKFYTLKGPIFANYVLTDEINRSPPRVQSALLEAMQSKQVTIGNNTYQLPIPFFVMATQNPIESVGTFPLPEAQMDRFLFKLEVPYINPEEERRVLRVNVTSNKFESYKLNSILSSKKILMLQDYVKRVFVSEDIEKYIVNIVDATRHPNKYKVESGKFIQWGSSPRASIGLFLAAQSHALMNNKSFVKPQDIKDVAYDVLRHRILLNYESQVEGVTVDNIIKDILEIVPIP